MSRGAIPALNVRWHDGRLVGRVISNGPTYFAYDDEWLARGHNLSPLVVPFTNATFRQRAEGYDHLPGFLSDCLPDQWGRRIMDRAFSALDVRATPMRRLAWVGRRGMGALTFEPALGNDDSASSWQTVTPALLVREAQAVMREEPARAFARLQLGGTAGGALPKATIARLADGTVLVGGDVAAALAAHPNARLGLIKLNCDRISDERETDGRVEHATMAMARASGIRTAKTEIMRHTAARRTRHHLFVERFDYVPGSARRSHLITLAGALHTHRLDYRHLLLTTRQLTRDQAEVAEAVRRMIFNVRAANHDDHGKNHSFLFDEATAQWTLSPAYDLTFNADEGRDYQGLTPNTFGQTPRLTTLAAVAADAGIGRDAFETIDADVTAAIERWPEFAAAAELPAAPTARAAAIHRGVANVLATEVTIKRGKRRKIWE